MTTVDSESPVAPPRPSRRERPDRPPDRAGLLLIDKPEGLTSHDAVERVRRRLRLDSAGHLGTLDPFATGLLLVATGAATRCALAWQGGEKTYEATLRFGIVTSTQDVHGEILERHETVPTPEQAIAAARAFVGELAQVPPMVSALKHSGERLYRLARRGIEVERAPRSVTVHAWEWLAFDGSRARFRVRCSTGTYVRTLAHDLGRALGTGAALERLQRLRSEPFALDHAVPLGALDHADPEAIWERHGLTLEQALAHLPRLVLDAAEEGDIGYGGRPAIALDRAQGLPLGKGPRSIVLRNAEDRVIALGEVRERPGDPERREVWAHVVLPWAVRQGRPR